MAWQWHKSLTLLFLDGSAGFITNRISYVDHFKHLSRLEYIKMLLTGYFNLN